MSQLRRQAESLRNNSAIQNHLEHGLPSILFSSKDASRIDLETIYSGAVASLQVISQYDERFSAYLDNLFHVSSKAYNRELKTADENAILDKRVSEFLGLLSPYTDVKLTHRILEYLIWRYRICEFNIDDVVRCVLPFYEEDVFNRIFDILHLQSSPWSFLVNATTISKDRLPLIVAKHMMSSKFVCDSFCRMLIDIALVHSSATHLAKQHEKIISFFLSITRLGFANASPSDAVTRALLAFAGDGLRVPLLKSASLTTLTIMSASISLSSVVSEAIISEMSNVTSVDDDVCALTSFCHYQGIKLIKKKIMLKFIHTSERSKQLLFGNIELMKLYVCGVGQILTTMTNSLETDDETIDLINAMAQFDGKEIHGWIADYMSPFLGNEFVNSAVGPVCREQSIVRLVSALQGQTSDSKLDELDSVLLHIEDFSQIECDVAVLKSFCYSRLVANKMLSTPKMMNWIINSTRFSSMSPQELSHCLFSSCIDATESRSVFGECLADNLAQPTSLALLWKLCDVAKGTSLPLTISELWNKKKLRGIFLSMVHRSPSLVAELDNAVIVDMVGCCRNDVVCSIVERLVSMYCSGILLEQIYSIVCQFYHNNDKDALSAFYNKLNGQKVSILKFQVELLVIVIDRLLIEKAAVGTMLSRLCLWTKSLIESTEEKLLNADELVSCQLLGLVVIVKHEWNSEMADNHVVQLVQECQRRPKKISKKKKDPRILDYFWGASIVLIDPSLFIALASMEPGTIVSSSRIAGLSTILLQIILQQSGDSISYLQSRYIRLCRLAIGWLRNAEACLFAAACCDLIDRVVSSSNQEHLSVLTCNDISLEIDLISMTIVQAAAKSDPIALQSILSIFSECCQATDKKTCYLLNKLMLSFLSHLQEYKEVAKQCSMQMVSLIIQRPEFFNAVVNLMSNMDVPTALSLLSGDGLSMVLELLRRVRVDLSDKNMRSQYIARLVAIIESSAANSESKELESAIKILSNVMSSSKQEIAAFLKIGIETVERGHPGSASMDELFCLSAQSHPDVFSTCVRQLLATSYRNLEKVLVCFRNGIATLNPQLSETLVSLMLSCLNSGSVRSFFAVASSFNEAGLSLASYFLMSKVGMAMTTRVNMIQQSESVDTSGDDEIDAIMREALTVDRSRKSADKDITISNELLKFFNSFPLKDQISAVSMMVRLASNVLQNGNNFSLCLKGDSQFYSVSVSELDHQDSHLLLLLSFGAQRLVQKSVSDELDSLLLISLCQEALILATIFEGSSNEAYRNMAPCCTTISNWCIENMDACMFLTFIELSTFECKNANLPEQALRFLHEIVDRQVNSSLNSRIDFDHDLCLDLLDKLGFIVGMDFGHDGKLFALLSVEKICGLLDQTKNLDSLTSVTNHVLEVASSSFQTNDEETCAASLTTIGSLVSCLSVAYFPFLAETCKLILKCLNHGNTGKLKIARLEATEDEASHVSTIIASSAFICFGSIVSHLSQFCHPYIQSVFETILSSHDYDEIGNDVKYCYDAIVSNVNPDHVLLSLLGVVELSSDSATFSMIVGRWFQVLDRPYVTSHFQQLSNLCIEVLNSSHKEGYCDAIVEFVLKLNRAELKGLYKRFVDWMRVEPINSASFTRRVRFYDLSTALQNRLEILFIPFVATAWTDIKAQLAQLHESTDDEGSKPKRKRNGGSNSLFELLQSLVSLLTAVFSFDKDTPRFVSSAVCGDEDDVHQIVNVLLLGSRFCPDEHSFSDFSENCVIPCISNLNCCLSSLSLEPSWRGLHHEVCCLTRHATQRVKIEALRTLSSLYETGDSAYMILIPEALPYLSECLEDDTVEHETRKLIEVMEKVSGEQLDEYMK